MYHKLTLNMGYRIIIAIVFISLFSCSNNKHKEIITLISLKEELGKQFDGVDISNLNHIYQWQDFKKQKVVYCESKDIEEIIMLSSIDQTNCSANFESAVIIRRYTPENFIIVYCNKSDLEKVKKDKYFSFTLCSFENVPKFSNESIIKSIYNESCLKSIKDSIIVPVVEGIFKSSMSLKIPKEYSEDFTKYTDDFPYEINRRINYLSED